MKYFFLGLLEICKFVGFLVGVFAVGIYLLFFLFLLVGGPMNVVVFVLLIFLMAAYDQGQLTKALQRSKKELDNI